MLDACRAAPVHVLANGDTGLVALLLAATHPDRVATLTLVNCYARLTSCTDYPFGDPPSIDEPCGRSAPPVHARPSMSCPGSRRPSPGTRAFGSGGTLSAAGAPARGRPNCSNIWC